MTVVDVVGMVVGIVLLAGNAFFVGAEFALVASRRTQIEPLAASGRRAARMTLRALENVSLMMAGAQLGITMCSLGLGAIAEPAVAHALEIPLEALGMPSALLHPIALAIALAIVLSLHMTVGEMVPKNIAIAGPGRAALILGPPLYAIVTVLRPFLGLINWIANHILTLLKVEPRDEVASTFTADEVAAFIEESKGEGLLDDSTHTLLTGSIAIAGTPVRAIAVPMTRLIAIDRHDTIGDLHQLCVDTGFSRFPIRDDRGVISGYVHIKDILHVPPDSVLPDEHIRSIIRVRETDSLEQVLSEMQVRGTHVALVTADDDSIVGAAMLEDVIEHLVGEVADAAAAGRSE
ncbi:hemolysin family protein [Gordonia sp. PKS22-38]|uniref:Hemolysin family protein n=1 Tax=Gordonia prachuapensis TaxID=3115651 RepID=A0ABU7MWH1_9ACTN|nr:hemolysin family protein [Gordonia sp. PKS22-38]